MIALRTPLVVAALAAACLAPASARAHFVLQSPPAIYEQSQFGDPQKAPPCGEDGNPVPTGVITPYMGGDKVTITIDETIYHPGHYRVALAVNDPSELPAEPPVTPDNKSDCGSAPIDAAPVFPVLADGLWVHDAPFDGPKSIEITLPTDVECDSCTLQVIQFMSDHALNNPGGCYYHHCAVISIQATQAGSSTGFNDDGGETATTEAPETSTTSAATESPTSSVSTTAPGDTSTGAPQGTSSGGEAPTTDAATGSTGTGTDAGEATTDGSTDDDKGGCSCDATGGRPALLASLVVLLALRPRRRGAAHPQ